MHASVRTSQRALGSALRLAATRQTHPLPTSLARLAFSHQPLEQRRHRWFSSTDSARNEGSRAEAETPDASRQAPADQSQPATEGPAADQKAAEAEPQVDPIAEMTEKHKEELRVMKHQLLRAMADFQNLQQRTERDVKSAREFAVQAFAKDLVSDLDVLSLALSSVPENQRSEEGQLKTLYNGVSMTATALGKTLARHGVVSFDPVGEVFDPNLHEASYQAPIPGKTPGTVFDVQKKGWKVGSRLLRPAQVGVVRAAE